MEDERDSAFPINHRMNMGEFPLNEESQMMNSLMSDKNVPKNVLKKYWWIFTSDTVLTFLDKDRKKSKLLAFDIAKIDYLATLPYYDYDFEVEQEINNLRTVYDTKLDRALGTEKTSQINERIAQKSQFNENRQFMVDGTSNSVKGGIFSKFLNRR
jgi:hypothetical protein